MDNELTMDDRLIPMPVFAVICQGALIQAREVREEQGEAVEARLGIAMTVVGHFVVNVAESLGLDVAEVAEECGFTPEGAQHLVAMAKRAASMGGDGGTLIA